MPQSTTCVALLLIIAQATLDLALPANKRQKQTCTVESEEDYCREHLMQPNMLTNKLALRTLRQAETEISYWLQTGQEHVAAKIPIAEQPLRGIAKNVIFFIGDGMSLTTQLATRIYLGGEEDELSFEKFPSVGLVKTYSLDHLVPDSASTATAYLGGVKAWDGTIGVSGQVRRGDCNAMQNEKNHVHSIAKWALDAGKSAGFVTTTSVTDATPAGFYAHISDRNWTNDRKVRQACGNDSVVNDIALQLIKGDVGKRLKVIMGGGKSQFIGEEQKGERTDGRNLIEEFIKEQQGNAYVETQNELQKINVKNTTRLMGLFASGHLKYNLSAIDEQLEKQPTLTEMIVKAIEMLRKNAKGYFLFVEGGLIDIAHHGTKAHLALDETAVLSRAVEAAREMTNMNDTLIVVSADHAHTMSISGYPHRHNDIFGLDHHKARDHMRFHTLNYANGPGYTRFYDTKNNTRVDPRHLNHTFNDPFPATVPMSSETHGGDDVGVYASGPWAHLFNGVYEQNVIPHLIGFASCTGEGLMSCKEVCCCCYE